ncbi:peptidylprolyl isomerase [Aneurinibacillus terranovensis]|uniref:peptidylprolyl isomerase n=1 Tax=Aneurinibacillus terranovensis TaxID=278991 RepID=UPI000425CC5A|nr:peptidylprolyl isomerase [Aneurinibacillus terranovensis]
MKQRIPLLILALLLVFVASACSTGKAQTQAPKPSAKQWSQPPAMQIKPNKTYIAHMQTNKGNITIELFAKDAPKTVNNFVFLSRRHFYDNVIFHRIIKNFMIQTGDPKGTGEGGPGYQFADELSSKHKYEKGIVAMANAGPNTNGSQFFICNGPASEGLNSTPNYTIFGKVTDGMDTVDKISNTPVAQNPMGEFSYPKEKVFIKTITIEEK